jgi:GTP-binding protein
MRFIDEVSIEIKSGQGGNGAKSFRREKFVPRGGPDGGNGGDGGSIFFEASEGINTLLHFRGRRFYKAAHGEDGHGHGSDGRSGEDLILKVPVGTVVRDKESGEILCDLTAHGQNTMIARGGRGGLGNTYFKTSTNQAPTYQQDGLPGDQKELLLELKLLADVALVGLPNAGKSTLISSLSKAKPKIADYPFTTLEPQLGVVAIDDAAVTVADIPGLIEDASKGRGLGIKFLKHIERASALVHLVDVSCCLDEFEAYESYITIRQELEKFDTNLASKKEVICLTKIDSMSKDEILKIQQFFEQTLDKKVLPISSVSRENLDLLKRLMLKTKEDLS